MGKAKSAPPPVAEVLTLESKATCKPTKIKISDLDTAPSIYSHRDPSIYVYKGDDDANQAKRLIESLIVAGQKSPIAFCIVGDKKVIICGHRRLEAIKTIIETKLDPERFHAAMEIDAVQVESSDPRDLMEWSLVDNEVRIGLTESEKVIAASKMLGMGFSSSRAARALGMSPTHFARYQRRLNSTVMRQHIALDTVSPTDADNLLEAAAAQNRTKDLERGFEAVVAQIEHHITDRRAQAVSRQEQFDEEKLGKVGSYIKPHNVREWIKDLKEGRSIDWEPEPEQSQRNFECSFDPKEGKLHIQSLNLAVHKLTYEEYGQLAAKLDITSRQVTADFLKSKAVREIRGLATQVEDSGVLDFYRKHGVADLEAALDLKQA
jgi:ParB-like chromosome segregation protein Spo0J